jgi:hypothetical protein
VAAATQPSTATGASHRGERAISRLNRPGGGGTK